MGILRFVRCLFSSSEESDPMKYLIVGLGNMGPDYDNTRHNVGFEVLDAIAAEFKCSFKNDTLGDLAQFRHKGRIIWLLKPSTFMNRSGKSVRYWMGKKKIQNENLLIVLDDTNLPLGTTRIRPKGSDGGHNGLKSIDQFLTTNQYSRLRIGIGNDYSKGGKVNFVLGKWSATEKEQLRTIIDRALENIKSFISIGVGHTMNKFNTKQG